MSFYVNPAVYAKNCVNKARPMMHCNGKCQMMKKMQQEEQQEKQDLERKAENKNELISSKSVIDPPAAANSITIKRRFAPYTSSQPVDKAYALFHPPSVA